LNPELNTATRWRTAGGGTWALPGHPLPPGWVVPATRWAVVAPAPDPRRSGDDTGVGGVGLDKPGVRGRLSASPGAAGHSGPFAGQTGQRGQHGDAHPLGSRWSPWWWEDWPGWVAMWRCGGCAACVVPVLCAVGDGGAAVSTQPADAALLPRGLPGVGQRPNVGGGAQAQPDQHDGGQHPQSPATCAAASSAALAGSLRGEPAALRALQHGVGHGVPSTPGRKVVLPFAVHLG